MGVNEVQLSPLTAAGIGVVYFSKKNQLLRMSGLVAGAQ
jgi:hypothetical protein